jgi:hypothetical protein
MGIARMAETRSGQLWSGDGGLSETLEGAQRGDGYRTTSDSWILNIYTPKGQCNGFATDGRGSGIEFVTKHRVIFRYEGCFTKS